MDELIGYARVSKADGSQAVDLQCDALIKYGVEARRIYQDFASGSREDRPGLAACLKALRRGDTLVVWKIDRLGRNLKHLVSTVDEITRQGVGLRVLSGQGEIDTRTSMGRLLLGLFASLAEFERSLIQERTIAGLNAARARGRVGGRRFSLTPAKLRLAQAAMGRADTNVASICRELGISRQTLYRLVRPDGILRPDGERLIEGGRLQV